MRQQQTKPKPELHQTIRKLMLQTGQHLTGILSSFLIWLSTISQFVTFRAYILLLLVLVVNNRGQIL